MRRRVACFGLGLVMFPLFALAAASVYSWRTGTQLYRNIGSSIAPGWYLCQPVPSTGLLPLGAVVEIDPPAIAISPLLSYLPDEWKALHWLKQVAVVSGDEVCVAGEDVRVDDQVVAKRPLYHDYPLPYVEGCWTVAVDEVFIMGTNLRSWDSRYFGPIDRAAVVGVCTALWTWEGK